MNREPNAYIAGYDARVEIDCLRNAIKMALTALGTDPQAELRIYKARTILNQALKA